MADLVAWLTKVLDEDEAMARAAIKDDGGRDGGFEDAFDQLTKGPDVAGVLAFLPRFGDAAAAMIVWNTPRRVLTDVAAKRAIIAEHTRNDGRCDTCFKDVWVEYGDPVIQYYEHYCRTVRLLASGYSARPGYDEEWRP